MELFFDMSDEGCVSVKISLKELTIAHCVMCRLRGKSQSRTRCTVHVACGVYFISYVDGEREMCVCGRFIFGVIALGKILPQVVLP